VEMVTFALGDCRCGGRIDPAAQKNDRAFTGRHDPLPILLPSIGYPFSTQPGSPS
jgi:hypothetical protein